MVVGMHGRGNLICHIVICNMSDESITIAHISDLHVDGSRHKHERAAQVIGYIAQLPSPPDVVVLTGDLADTGTPAEYDELRELFAELRDPPLICPGNHDERAAFRQHLLGTPGDESPINQARRAAGALFALCDSSVPGKAGGAFDEETLGWLDRTLGDNGDLKAFVVCHHPPATLHSPFIDAIKLDGEEALARVIRRHDNVVAMLCGHAHTPAVTTFANRPLLLAPGVSSTLKLPFELSDGWRYNDVLDTKEPPMLAFHVIADDARVTTHYRVVKARTAAPT
jgi:3',5'-cyclic AMP phosphodiesterase CpdA